MTSTFSDARDSTSLTEMPGSVFGSGGSRREFLKSLVAAGAAAVLPPSRLFAQSVSRGALARTGRIDVHHHIATPEWVKAARIGANWHWTPAVSLEQMDKYGIATAILSVTQPGVWYGDVEQARKLSRDCNEAMARTVHDYPGRFGLFAALPLPDQDGTMREIEYAFDTLKADGIGLLTSYDDKWLGDPSFMPTFEELNRHNAIVFVHASGPACCRNLVPGVTATMSEYDFDTARAVESLLVNGTFSKFPSLRFILVHSGGTLPVLAGRINDRFPKDRLGNVPDGVLPTLKKLYYEVAHATYPAPLAALTKFVPMSQILFGTDYPAESIETTITPLAEFGLSASDFQAINRRNAEGLFPRLKG